MLRSEPVLYFPAKVGHPPPTQKPALLPTGNVAPPFLVWIDVYSYVDRCVHRVYYVYLGNARKHAQPGRPETVTERRLA